MCVPTRFTNSVWSSAYVNVTSEILRPKSWDFVHRLIVIKHTLTREKQIISYLLHVQNQHQRLCSLSHLSKHSLKWFPQTVTTTFFEVQQPNVKALSCNAAFYNCCVCCRSSPGSPFHSTFPTHPVYLKWVHPVIQHRIRKLSSKANQRDVHKNRIKFTRARIAPPGIGEQISTDDWARRTIETWRDSNDVPR